MSYILASDIGGTKTLLQISATDKPHAPVLKKSYRSTDYAGLAEMLDEFLCEAGTPKIAAACLALPSAISGRRVKLTNLSWVVDADAIECVALSPIWCALLYPLTSISVSFSLRLQAVNCGF